MQEVIHQLSCITLRSPLRFNRLLRPDALSENSGLCRFYRQLHSNHQSFDQKRLLNPCVVKCDPRSFHNHCNYQRKNPLWTNNSTLFHQGSSPSSVSISSFSSYVPSSKYDDSELLHAGPPLSNRFCVLQNYENRIPYFRAFSTEKNSSTPSDKTEKEAKQPEEEEDDSKLSLYQRFKKTYKQHGKVFIAVHLITSAGWFGTFYTAARCGVDIVPLLESWNLSDKFINPFRSGGLGDVALAYLMYKLATPARYTVTTVGTNVAIRYLRKGGKLNTVRKEDTLREMYKEGKADLKSKGINTKRRMRNIRTRIQGRMRRGRRRNIGEKKDH